VQTYLKSSLLTAQLENLKVNPQNPVAGDNNDITKQIIGSTKLSHNNSHRPTEGCSTTCTVREFLQN